MLQYIVECIAFQLVFLVIYDLFLKRETFFRWNRVYLLFTYVLSIVLPWVKIEAFRTSVPQTFEEYPEFWWNLERQAITIQEAESSLLQLTWQEGVLYGGMLVATLLFCYKIAQVYRLKKKGIRIKYADFTQIIIPDSTMAFSFFRSIFLGDKVIAKNHRNIIAHELVHIKQGHTWDLLFFELMRIIGWFNPLVYVYQSRTAELHEFIADAHVAKDCKSEHYQQLLSQVFQTEHISFINQFFTTSLIKKRIVMLQKSKSKKVWQLKYLVLIPLVLGMLFYTSCELEKKELEEPSEIVIEDLEMNPLEERSENVNEELKNGDLLVTQSQYNSLVVERNRLLKSADENNPIIINLDEQINLLKERIGKENKNNTTLLKHQANAYSDDTQVSFGAVEEVPLFPGCENAVDKRACFNEKMQLHISKNFNYPSEAQKSGIQGRVSTMFIITAEGAIANIKMRGPDKLLEDEVERIIKKLPQMTPGQHKGEAVNVSFSIPVNFKLQ